MDIQFVSCAWEEIRGFVASRLRERRALADSYWEDHVLGANHYKMLCGEELAGCFAIHGKETLVLFDVLPAYAHLAQALFARAKAYETVTRAMVVTDDGLFVSLCMDQFDRLEKQAYFAAYTGRKPREDAARVSLSPVTIQEDREAFGKCGDFFSKEELERLEKGVDHMRIYLARRDGVAVGLGVLEYGRVLTENASIGMCVYQEFRRQGLATAILRALQEIACEEGLTPVSGCWYYNHNSKKSQEAAGAYCPVRLVHFCF